MMLFSLDCALTKPSKTAMVKRTKIFIVTPDHEEGHCATEDEHIRC